MRLNGDVSGAPITFTVEGKQYVAVGAGGRMGPTLSLAPLTGGHVSDGSGVVWVFAVQSEEDDQISRRSRPQPVLTSASGVRTSAPAETRVAASPDKPRSGQPVTANAIGAQDGLFTAAQAARGEEHFKQACMTCHKVEEQTGASFRASWGRGTVGEFLTVISRTMPRSSPGSLTPDAYASIVAFYLRQSGYPTGGAELSADATALSRVRIER
jgi:mono/diheme cytochrome c family protein